MLLRMGMEMTKKELEKKVAELEAKVAELTSAMLALSLRQTLPIVLPTPQPVTVPSIPAPLNPVWPNYPTPYYGDPIDRLIITCGSITATSGGDNFSLHQ